MKVKLSLESNVRTPISRQLADQLAALIQSRQLPIGVRLPSIRQLAATQQISRFPVIEAYDQLISRGLIQAKHGSGYYVIACTDESAPAKKLELEAQAADEPSPLMLSSGFIPEQWRDVEGIAQVVKLVSRTDRKSLTEYAAPQGELALRRQIVLRLRRLGVDAQAQDLLTTHSASHALDLVARMLVKPGDTVFVEDPGYFNLLQILRMQGARLVAVPRDERGPDIGELERLLKQHRPSVFFVNSALHNPTGGSISSQAAFRLLQLAERHDLTIVEDDVYADFQEMPTQRLAALDQLQRVIYIGGFSKTLSSSLRTGWIAARQDLVTRLVELKALTGAGSSRLTESVIAELLERGLYRKHLERLRRMVDSAFSDARRRLDEAGWVLHSASCGGYNLWARVPGVEDSASLVSLALRHDVKLLAGAVFRPGAGMTPWTRLNAVHLGDRRALAFIAAAAQRTSETAVCARAEAVAG